LDSNSDSDDFTQRHSSLGDAVKYHPLKALRALTDRLGMDYDRITKRILDWEANRREQEQRRVEKRKHEITDRGLGRNMADDAALDTARDTAQNKFRKIDAERTSTEEPPSRLPIKDLVGNSESIHHSSPESGTKIE